MPFAVIVVNERGGVAVCLMEDTFAAQSVILQIRSLGAARYMAHQ